MKHLTNGAKGWNRLPVSRRCLPSLCLLGCLWMLGCSREAVESLRASPPTPQATSQQVNTPEQIPPQQTVGGPVGFFVHRPAQGESETKVVPPGGSNSSLPLGASVGESSGPTLGEIAPTIIAAAQPSGSATGSPTVRWVDLTLPVSLPQTGPEGTIMSFGVEYRLLPEAPRDQTFAWVIQSRSGKIFRLDGLQLDQQGNLMTIVAEWRPEDGPFCSWIEDAVGHAVSRKLDF